MKKMVCVSCLLVWAASNIRAQSHIDASGGNASGSGGNASYSVGQIDYVTQQGTGGIITEGVQQPYEIYKVSTGIDEPGIELNAVVFPNPTSDFIELQINTAINEPLRYNLLDLNGKLIGQNTITGSSTKINMASLSGGIYFINVIGSNQLIKSFKIIKTI